MIGILAYFGLSSYENISILMTVFVVGFTEWKIMARYFFVTPILYAVVLEMLHDSLKEHSEIFSCFLLIVIALTVFGNLYKYYKKCKNTALFENSYIEKVFNTYTIYI